jgi:general secretion pathway protein G
MWTRLNVVIPGIAILAAATVWSGRHAAVECSRIGRVQGDLQILATQLMFCREVIGQYPTDSQGLKALVERPADLPPGKRWQQLLPSIMEDPWGEPYQYRLPSTRSSAEGYDLFSCGKDREADTPDDLGNWDWSWAEARDSRESTNLLRNPYFLAICGYAAVAGVVVIWRSRTRKPIPPGCSAGDLYTSSRR